MPLAAPVGRWTPVIFMPIGPPFIMQFVPTVPRAQLRALALASLSLLAACGGGGGSSEEDLNVGFTYANQAPIYLWNATEVPALISGLEGNTPDCRVSSGTLPAGLTLNGRTCAVTGAPTETGDFFVSITLEVDGFNGSVSNNLALSVVPPELAYDIDTAPRPWGELIKPLAPQWTGYTPQAGDVLTYSADGADPLPAGLSIDADTGRIVGTPDEMDPDKRYRNGFIKAKVQRAGKTMQVFGNFGFNIDAPFIDYDAADLMVNQAFTHAPLLPTAMTDGSYSLNFKFVLPRNNCNIRDLALDNRTGVLSGTPTVDLPGPCEYLIEWTAAKNAKAMKGISTVLLRIGQ